MSGTDLIERVSQLRSAFDRSFAAPARSAAIAREEMLAIRVGGQACAVRLAQIAGMFAYRQVTHVPGDIPAMLGIAGFRGAIISVYDLRVLLGYDTAAALRWVVLAAAAPVALAFEGFEGQLRVAREDIVVQSLQPDLSNSAPREFVRTEKASARILSLQSVLAGVGA